RIHDMAIKDPLTTLYNRRFFNERIEEEINRSRRTRFPLSCIYLDIDHFKKYNDQNGHQSGDVLLKQISALMKKSSRKTDIVARLGGEEFCILLPHTDAEGAAIKAEKLRRLVESTNFANREKQPMGFVSISVGVSEYPSHAHDADGLVKAADDALYNVKESTRNRVALANVGEAFKRDFEPLPVPKKEVHKK
ncbi:MAG: GGDEF domain-containing protein, partial [Bdellovibrionota bacterium]|nr:GGDEF domain-containing protein [Bdellovibrionota bacterium]